MRRLMLTLLLMILSGVALAATPAEMDAIEAELRMKRGDPTYTLPRAGGSHMSELSMREMYGLVPSTRDITATTGTLMRPPGNIGAWSPRAERLVSPEGAAPRISRPVSITSCVNMSDSRSNRRMIGWPERAEVFQSMSATSSPCS